MPRQFISSTKFQSRVCVIPPPPPLCTALGSPQAASGLLDRKLSYDPLRLSSRCLRLS